MKEQLLEYLFKKSPVALSYHKAIFNKEGVPDDCEFLDVNNIYENIIGLKDYEVIGKRYNEIFHAGDVIGHKWKKAYQDAVINKRTVDIDVYNKAVLKWIRITIFILDKWHFACIFNDVSKEYMKQKEIEGTLEANINMLGIIDENFNFVKAKSNGVSLWDEDTGLLSIDFFNKRIEEEIERADRYNDPLSMMILALDNFKTHILDYSVKEDVIKEIAKITSSVIRKYDILARIDSEKFILLMPKTNKNGAGIVAEKIRKALNDNIHPIVGKFIASFGISERVKAESLKQWQERLKTVLHKAQEQGGNFIIIAEFEEKLVVNREKVEWKNEWNSGNIEIDKQHQELLEILNNLINVSTIEMNFQKGINQLDILIDSIVKHFNYEEEILNNIGYKDYDKHYKIHKNLIGKVFQLKQCYQNRGLNSAAFFSFIADDVIIGHLINEDMQFFDLIKSNFGQV